MGNPIRLKEQLPSANTAMDAVHNRYAPPKPPTAMERFAEAFKRFGRTILLAAAVLAVFLVIPFRSWDDYAIWQHLQQALIRLETQPDSLPNLKQAIAAAEPANILWDQPSGARPEKWYQFTQRNLYDARYGVIQVLAIGTLKQGNVSRGVSELERLQQRTGLSSLPDLPSIHQTIRTCSQCKDGKIEGNCQACEGQGGCKRCNGQGSVTIPTSKSAFPLTAKLRNTRVPDTSLGDEALRISHNCQDCQSSGKCPACAGTGKRTTTCPTCGGRVTIINFAADPNLFRNTVKGTITAIGKGMTLRRVMHSVANAQRALLRSSGEVSTCVLSAVHGDDLFTSTNSVTAFLQPARSNETAATAGQSTHDDATAEHGNVTQSLSEKRLQIACETLQLTPLSVANLQILADVARSETNNPVLRSHAMAAYALALLIQGNTNAFSRAAQIQRDLFPDPPPLITITPKDYTALCTDCLGEGEKRIGCPFCRGSGKCKTCDGLGNVAAENGSSLRCPACKFPGVCVKCEGQTRMIISCPTCKGAGNTFKPNDAVRNNYNALLTNMVALCQGKGDVAKPLSEAQSDRGHDSQNKTSQAMTNRVSDLAEPEAQNRSQREVASLRKLEQAEHTGGAIATLRTYLDEHTGSPDQKELQHLLDGLIAKQERKQLTRKILMSCGVLIGVFLLIMILRPLRLRRPAATSGALPGMSRINKAAFVDPLTLTALDSRSRSKKETSEIPLPDERNPRR